jgi:hypothetical protein
VQENGPETLEVKRVTFRRARCGGAAESDHRFVQQPPSASLFTSG